MGKLWQLMGPDEDVLTLEQTARLFGYEVRTLRRLISEGRFPAPRGFGQNLFYTGDDLSAVRLLLGRWQPQEEPDAGAHESGQNPHKGGRNRPKPAQEVDSEA